MSNIGPDSAHHPVDTTGEGRLSSCRAYPGIGRSLGSLSLTSGLSHRVKDRIYWTKVSINTFVSDDHVGVADPRGMKPSFGFVSGRDFSRAVEAQQRSGLKSMCENRRKATAGPSTTLPRHARTGRSGPTAGRGRRDDNSFARKMSSDTLGSINTLVQ
jgi:hypothetical protein